jgi:hypothetical protein
VGAKNCFFQKFDKFNGTSFKLFLSEESSVSVMSYQPQKQELSGKI